MKIKALFLFLALSIVMGNLGGTAWGDSFVMKNWVDDAKLTGPSDFYMDWAAAASNALYWGKWGTSSFNTPVAIFNNYKAYWDNQTGRSDLAIRWWFNGSVPSPIWYPDIHVKSGGGNYWPSYQVDKYLAPTVNHIWLDQVPSLLKSSKAVIAMIESPVDHKLHATINIWGYETGSVDYIYFTDPNVTSSGLVKRSVDLVHGHFGGDAGFYADWSFDIFTLQPRIYTAAVKRLSRDLSYRQLFSLPHLLTFDLKFENLGGDSRNYLYVGVPDPAAEDGVHILSKYFYNDPASGFGTDFVTESLVIPEELRGVRDLIVAFKLFDDSMPMVEVAGLEAIPLPPSIWLLASGLLGLGALRRRKI